MAIQRVSCTFILLACLVLLLAAPATAQEPPTVDARFGIVDSFVNTAEATAAGAGWTRVFFRWDVIQPGGPADWKPANVPDPFLNAEVEAGREVVGVIIGTPAWASEQGTSTAMPPLEYWGDFVFKLATQYKGRVSRWVIWNQPDITDSNLPGYTWSGTEEDYYRLLKEAYLKIKTVDPTMQVHVAGLTYTWDQQQGNRQYLDRLLDAILRDPDAANNNYFFDAVTYHVYYDPAQILQVITDVKAILSARGLGDKPVWLNETNAPPSEDFIEPPVGEPVFRVSLEEQSAFVLQAFALALAGGAERIAFNKMRNDRNLAATGVPYGLLRADDSRRPAFDAFVAARTYYANTRQATWQRLDDINIVTLDRAGQTTTVLWNMGRSPIAYNLNAISTQALLVNERAAVQTISAENGTYSLELPAAVCTNGDYCFIGGAPRLVVESGSPAQRAPLTDPGSAAVPAPVTQTEPPTPTLPPPTATPIPPPPTVTPLPAEAAPPTAAPVDAIQQPAPDAAPPPAVLPETDAAQLPPADTLIPESPADAGQPTTVSTAVPPVTLGTIFRPERLLWLFVIGIIVFTVAYGIQVALWSRLKR